MTDPTKRAARHRTARLRDVPLDLMRVNPIAQRDLNKAWVDELFGMFDPEAMQPPHVNERDGLFWILDGQHTIAALKLWLGDWHGQRVQCWTYRDLTVDQEAEVFLRLQQRKTVRSIDAFLVAVTAGRPDETDIDRIARVLGLRVGRSTDSIRAVSALERVYSRGGAACLNRTLRIIRDAYGKAGFSSSVIDGIGLLVQRYANELDDARAVAKLSAAHAGVNGLMNQARTLKTKTGMNLAECVAITAVDVINGGRGPGKKLPKWRGEAAS